MLKILLLNLLFLFSSNAAHAAEIIVNHSVPNEIYSLDEVRAIFTMRLARWHNGESIKVFVMPDNHPVHKAFAKKNLNMFPHQLRSIWDKLTYSGTGVTPTLVSSVEEMLQAVSYTQNSIGYLETVPLNANIYRLQTEQLMPVKPNQ